MAENRNIAIIGIGCRFPGADDIDEFWRVLRNGENHVTEIPDDRWSSSAYFNTDPDAQGKTYATKAGLVKTYREWDNHLFGINDIEAERMDPQQRFVLDCVHMAMEDGGITRKELNGSDTAVYIGTMNSDFKDSLVIDAEDMTNYSLTGVSTSIVAARVAYVFNLLGPAMTVDTACSSALVAIHTASQAILSGESSMAICGGVSAILGPEPFIALSRARMVGRAGQCQAFSDKADGYARGEGCGIVILKEYNKAVEDGNKIWGSIRTACNQDGRTATPMTAPSGQQQRALLEKVYKQYNVDPGHIQYIEAHGTGTPAGDPVEGNTLGQFFDRRNTSTSEREATRDRLKIGSVKSNIGHLESAAGAAGLIKVLLMMKHRLYVPTLFCDRINPKVEFDKYGIDVCREVSRWEPSYDGGRFACINSFGFGGTNAHAIVSQYPCIEKESCSSTDSDNNVKPVAISSSCKASLIRSLEMLKESLNKDEDVSLEALFYTSTCRRDHYPIREAFCAKTKDALIDQIEERLYALNTIDTKAVSAKPRVIFVFCGVGTVWRGMCQEFLQKEQVFVQTLENVSNLLEPLSGWSLLDRLKDGADDFDDPLLGHLAIYASQIGILALWRHYGVRPDVIVGQSVGEVAAAYAAGILTLEESIHVIYHRSSMLARVTGGKMLVVANCDTRSAEEMCKTAKNGKVSIAVYTSPSTSVLAGDVAGILEIKEMIKEKNTTKENLIIVKELQVKCAYHSHHVECLKDKACNAFSSIKGKTQSVPIISTVSGDIATENDFIGFEYWWRNMRDTVYLQKALEQAVDKGKINLFVEIGPRQILRSHMKDIFQGKKGYISMASMGENEEVDCIRRSVAKLYEHGIDLNWHHIVNTTKAITTFPKYHFNRKFNLHEANKWKLQRLGFHSVNGHSFIRRSADRKNQFLAKISQSSTPLLYKHVVDNTPIIPGAFYAEIGFEVAKQVYKCECHNVEVSTEIHKPLVLSDNKAYDLQIDTNEEEDICGRRTLVYQVYADGMVASGAVMYLEEMTGLQTLNLQEIRRGCRKAYSRENIYGMLETLGFEYDEDLKVLHEAVSGENDCLVEVNISDAIWKELVGTNFHPSVLDGLVQTPGVLLDRAGNWSGKTILPAGIRRLVLRQPLKHKMLAYTFLKKRTDFVAYFDLLLLTHEGVVIAEINDYAIQKLEHTHEEANPFSVALAVTWKKVWSHENAVSETSQSSICIDCENILALSFSTTKLDELQRILPNINLHQTVIQPIQGIEGTVRKLFNANKRAWASVLFVPGLKSNDTDLCGETVMETVQSSCTVLLALVNELYNRSMDMPLFVITENIVDDKCFLTDCNIFGSELHGFVKSILKEHMYDNIRVIDVHPNLQNVLTRKSLQNILNGSISETVLQEKHIRLTGDAVFVRSVVSKSPITKPTLYREMCFDPTLKTELFCAEGNSADMHLKLSSPVEMQNNHDMCPLVEISVDQVILPATNCSQVFFWERNPSTCKRKEDERRLYCLEMSGFLVDDFEYTNEDTTVTKHSARRVIGCFPVPVSTKIRLPQACVCYEDELPGYIPGLIATLLMFWELMEKIPKDSNVAVLYADETPYLLPVLVALLKSMKSCTTAVINGGCGSDEQEFDTYIAIGSSLEHLEKLLASPTHRMKHVLMFHETDDVALNCIRRTMTLTVFTVLDIRHVFSPANTLLKLPSVLEWLKCQNGEISNQINGLKSIPLEGTPNVTFPYVKLTLNSLTNPGPRIRISEGDLFQKHACYILIGGLTGLGWELLQLMAERGAGTLVSLTRRAPNEHQTAMIQEVMDRYQCRILPIQADVCKMETLNRAHEQIRSVFKGPIKGIFHGGGSVDNQLAVNVTDDLLRNTLLPKVLGTWNLHEWSVNENLPLDYFVMHSSIASLLGSAGQVCYSAANSFMDSFAFYRRSLGLPGQTINWGALDLGMMTEFLSNKAESSQHQLSLRLLTKAEIRSSFLHAVFTNDIQAIYTAFNTKHSRTQPSTGQKETVNSTKQMKQFVQQIISAMEEQKNEDSECVRMELTKCITSISSEVFAVSTELITSDTDFLSLGLDSMLGMTFINRVFELLRVRIPVVKMLSEGSSVRTIVDFLTMEMQRRSINKPNIEIPKCRLLSFLQTGKFEMYENEAADPSLVLFLDVDIPYKFANANKWRSNLQFQLENNAVLRHLYVRNNDKSVVIKTVPLTEAKIDFRIVNEKSLTHENRLPPDGTQYHFDLRKNLAFRILFAKRQNGNAIVRMIFHLICFDLESVWMFLEDVTAFAYHRIHDGPLPKQRPDIDVASIMSDHVSPLLPELESFWKRHVTDDIHLVTLAQTDVTEVSYHGFVETIKEFTTEGFSRMHCFLHERKITLFEFLTSIYQLVLHKRTGKAIVPVKTNVDMRYHVPDLVGAMSWCVNSVALVGRIRNKQSPKEFVVENSSEIQDSLRHGQYPFELLLSNLHSEEAKAALTKHTVVHDDVSFSSVFKKFDSDEFTVRRVTHGNLHCETTLFIEVNYTTNKLRLELLNNAALIGKNTAEEMLNQMSQLIFEVLEDI